jgi:cytochrome c556
MSGVTSAREVARRLGLSHTAIQNAERAGRIAREPNGAWDIEKVRAGLATKSAPAPRKPYGPRAKQPPWARTAHHVGELAANIRGPARGIHAELERARQALQRAAEQIAALYPEILRLERACDAAIAAQERGSE